MCRHRLNLPGMLCTLCVSPLPAVLGCCQGCSPPHLQGYSSDHRTCTQLASPLPAFVSVAAMSCVDTAEFINCMLSALCAYSLPAVLGHYQGCSPSHHQGYPSDRRTRAQLARPVQPPGPPSQLTVQPEGAEKPLQRPRLESHYLQQVDIADGEGGHGLHRASA